MRRRIQKPANSSFQPVPSFSFSLKHFNITPLLSWCDIFLYIRELKLIRRVLRDLLSAGSDLNGLESYRAMQAPSLFFLQCHDKWQKCRSPL